MIVEKVKSFKDMLHSKNLAYLRVFNKQSVDTNIVLKDLAKFCRAFDSTFHSDPRIHAVLEGRREVWLRIMEHLNFNTEQIYDLHKIKEINPGGEV